MIKIIKNLIIAIISISFSTQSFASSDFVCDMDKALAENTERDYKNLRKMLDIANGSWVGTPRYVYTGKNEVTEKYTLNRSFDIRESKIYQKNIAIHNGDVVKIRKFEYDIKKDGYIKWDTSFATGEDKEIKTIGMAWYAPDDKIISVEKNYIDGVLISCGTELINFLSSKRRVSVGQTYKPDGTLTRVIWTDEDKL